VIEKWRRAGDSNPDTGYPVVDFKFSNRQAPSGTIGHHWQQSQAVPEPSVEPLCPFMTDGDR